MSKYTVLLYTSAGPQSYHVRATGPEEAVKRSLAGLDDPEQAILVAVYQGWQEDIARGRTAREMLAEEGQEHEPDELLSSAQLRDIVGVSPAAITLRMRAGKLVPVRRNPLMFRREDADEWRRERA